MPMKCVHITCHVSSVFSKREEKGEKKDRRPQIAGRQRAVLFNKSLYNTVLAITYYKFISPIILKLAHFIYFDSMKSDCGTSHAARHATRISDMPEIQQSSGTGNLLLVQEIHRAPGPCSHCSHVKWRAVIGLNCGFMHKNDKVGVMEKLR